MTDDILSYLCVFRRLEYFDMSGCHKVTNGGMKHLGTLSIEQLNMSGCIGVTNNGLINLRSLSLEYLNMSGCNITDYGLLHLVSGHERQEINDDSNDCEQNICLMSLKYLDISYCHGIAG